MSFHARDADDSASLRESFRELCLRFGAHAEHDGIRVVPFQSEEVPLFGALPVAKQEQAVHDISETIAVCEEMRAEGRSLRDSSRFLWRTLRRLGLTPRGDVFDKIGDEHLVVVFGMDQRQLFRNLEFLKMSILTLEELYCTEWFRYSRRDPVITQRLGRLLGEYLSGKREETMDPEIEEHELEQVGTAPWPVGLRLKIDYVSPLYQEGRLAGIVAIERAWPVKWQGAAP